MSTRRGYVGEPALATRERRALELAQATVERLWTELTAYCKTLDPHNAQKPVVCLDEKAVSLHDEVRLPQAARPGVVVKRDSEFRRKGTANLFVPLDHAQADTLRCPHAAQWRGVRQCNAMRARR